MAAGGGGSMFSIGSGGAGAGHGPFDPMMSQSGSWFINRPGGMRGLPWGLPTGSASGLHLACASAAHSSSEEADARPSAVGKKQVSFKGGVNLSGFPLKAGLTAGGLALAGDTIAQFLERHRKRAAMAPCCRKKVNMWDHDLVRAARMGTYGFLLYGPGSHFWYELLDRLFAAKTVQNTAMKVFLNQVVWGPVVLVVVFAWNYAWMGRVKEIPNKYRSDFYPALMDGWKFWIPASVVNFAAVPLQGRVLFMSTCAIFWNFYLSLMVSRS